jgi:uroporphyrin-III C-methyltransferase/precorrin-2 dehydrogenase/sirohydrochlorin ferrochelatase
MADLLPLFLNLTGRTVVLVGGGPVATAKLRQLVAAGAHVRVIAPEMTDEIRDAKPPSVAIERRPFARRRSTATSPKSRRRGASSSTRSTTPPTRPRSWAALSGATA